MPVSTLTSKGQITLPQDVRAALGLQSGDKVDFIAVDGGFKVVAVQRDVQSLRGRFAGRVSEAVSIDAMNDAVHAEAARRHRPAAAAQPTRNLPTKRAPR